MLNSNFALPRWAYALLVLVFAYVFYNIWYSTHEFDHLTTVHSQQMDDVEGFSQDVVASHLWLAKHLIPPFDAKYLAEYKAKAASAQLRLDRLLALVLTHGHPSEIADDIAQAITELAQNWQQVKQFAARRIADPLHAGTNSELDIAYDMELDKALELAERIETRLRQANALEVAGFERNRMYLFGSAVLAMLLALVVLWRVDAVRRRNAELAVETARSLDASQKDFRDLFELSPVSLWLEDFSRVKAHLLSLKDSGADDLHAYCESHSEQIKKCAELVRILDVNQATLDLHGAESKEQLLAGLEKTFTDESYEVFKKEVLAFVDGQTEVNHPARVQRLDGTPVDVIISVRVMPGHEENLDKVLVALVDVAELKAAEKERLKSESRFKTLVEQSPFSIQVFSPSGRTLQVNKAWEALWGVTLEHIAGYNVLEDQQLIDKGIMPYMQKAFAGEGAEIPPVNYNPAENEDISGPANDRWVRAYTYPVKDESGQITEVILMHEDVTEKLHAEKQLKQNQKILEEAQRIAHFGSWELDLVTNKLIWSDEIYRIFELDKDEFGASYEAFLDAIHPDDLEMVNEAYTKSLETKQPYEITHRLLMKDGRIKYVNEQCETFFSDEQDIPIRSVGTVQDITELVEIRQKEENQREKLEHVQRLESLGILAGGIAHDFNNILTSIMGNAGRAERKLEKEAPAFENVNRIMLASQKAAGLCKQMLAYSGKGKFIVESVDLSLLVEEMSRLLEVSISKNVVLKEHLAENLPAIEADVGQIQQIVMNLITNANEAIDEKSGIISLATGLVAADAAYLKQIEVDVDLPEGNYVYLEVSDTGCGMDEETRGKIFDPFFTTKFTGRGLGMSAILGIVRGHKGAIKCYSEPGKGTTFKILFPSLDKLPEKRVDAGKGGDEWRGTGLVLIVDDEETICETASLMLKDAGFETAVAFDGIQGLEKLKEYGDSVEAVILDMTMPNMDGVTCFSEMKKFRPDIKVLLSSGYNEQDATSRFAGKGLAGFIQKPYTPDQLIEKMKELFNKT